MRVPAAQVRQPDQVKQLADGAAPPAAGERPAAGWRPAATLPRTVRCGNSAPSCGTKPMCRRSGGTGARPASTLSPPRVTVPASAASNPAITRSRVVLPAPEAPRIAVSVPGLTDRETPRSTGTAP